MAVVTTGVEVETSSGSRACLDSDGWRSDDPALVALLETHAPLGSSGADPLRKAAKRAVEQLGVRILSERRHGGLRDALAKAPSRLYRALTDSTLAQVLRGPGLDADPKARRAHDDIRLVVLGTVLLACALGLALGIVLAVRG